MARLESFFDAAFVITLPQRTDRWNDFRAEWNTFGTSLSLGIWDGIIHPTSANHGCSNAHRTLIKWLSTQDWQRSLIMEDDNAAITSEILHAAGHRPGTKVWDTFHKVPGVTLNDRFDFLSPHVPADWDVLYLGAGYGEAPIARVNEFVLRVGNMKTTSSYGITREFSKKLTAELDKRFGGLENYPGAADDMLTCVARENKYYCLQPRLCYQRESKSDITGNSNSYLDSMTNPLHENML